MAQQISQKQTNCFHRKDPKATRRKSKEILCKKTRVSRFVKLGQTEKTKVKISTAEVAEKAEGAQSRIG